MLHTTRNWKKSDPRRGRRLRTNAKSSMRLEGNKTIRNQSSSKIIRAKQVSRQGLGLRFWQSHLVTSTSSRLSPIRIPMRRQRAANELFNRTESLPIKRCRQEVRHRTLTPALGGSIPPTVASHLISQRNKSFMSHSSARDSRTIVSNRGILRLFSISSIAVLDTPEACSSSRMVIPALRRLSHTRNSIFIFTPYFVPYSGQMSVTTFL